MTTEDEKMVRFRSDLLEIVGAVGSIRDLAAGFESSNLRYVEDELSKIQTAVHRLLEFLDHLFEQRN